MSKSVSAAKTRFKYLGVFLSLILVLTFVITVPSVKAETFRWRVQHPWPSGSMYDAETKKFAERVKQLTDGRLQITMFGVGTLAGTFESLDALSKGVYEGHISIPTYWSGKMPVGTMLTSVSGGFSSPQDWNAWYYNYGGLEIAREAYSKFNIHYVGPITTTADSPTFTREGKAIKTLADFKGMKLRSTSGLQAELLQAMGASPVFMPVQDVYTAMETGVVDGVTAFTIVGWKNLGIHEISKYATKPGFILPDTALEFSVGKKAWDKLPDDLKGIMEAALREFSSNFYGFGIIEDAKAFKVMTDSGIEVLNLPEDDVAKALDIARSLADKYAEKDALSKRAWDSQKAYLKEIGKLK